MDSGQPGLWKTPPPPPPTVRMAVPLRRKRDDDSSWVAGSSQCSDSLGVDVNSMSATAGSSSVVPPRPHKRRRTTLIDQLQQIHLHPSHASSSKTGEEEDDDANDDVPYQILQDNAVDDSSQISYEGEEEEEEYVEDEPLVDPTAAAQRALVRELVFGKRSEESQQPMRDVVDVEIQKLVRQSLERTQEGKHPISGVEIVEQHADDMAIDPSYARPSDVFPIPFQRERSNSLPNLQIFEEEDDVAVVDMEDARDGGVGGDMEIGSTG